MARAWCPWQRAVALVAAAALLPVGLALDLRPAAEGAGASTAKPASAHTVRLELGDDTIRRLNQARSVLGLGGADYGAVLERMLDQVLAQPAMPQWNGNRSVHLSQGADATAANATETEQQKAKTEPCVFDDDIFGLDASQKIELRSELGAGALKEGLTWVKSHANAGWVSCAYAGETCACQGNVRYLTRNWMGPIELKQLPSPGTVACTAEHFGVTDSGTYRGECQCQAAAERAWQGQLQKRFTSWSLVQEAYIMLLRTLSMGNMLPFIGDRNKNGPLMFTSRTGQSFDRVWMDRFFKEVGSYWVKQQFGDAAVQCMEWDAVVIQNLYPNCAQGAHIFSYEPDPAKMGFWGNTIYADIAQIPKVMGGKMLDVVMNYQVWEHVNEPFSAMEALYSVINPGGVLLFTVPFQAPFHGVPDDYWRYTKSGVVHIMERAGFCVPRGSVTCGGDYITTIGLFSGMGPLDFSQDELDMAYHQGFDVCPDGAIGIFAVGIKKRVATDACPEW